LAQTWLSGVNALGYRRSMNPSFVVLGWRQLWRDWRAGELRLLALAVTLAVAALCAVGFFADRMQSGLVRDARQLLGGDAVVVSDEPLPPGFVAQARALGLALAPNLTFPTMARARDADGGQTRLVALKAVTSAYPLRGQLLVRAQPGLAPQALRGGPQPGQVWVEPAVLESLGLRVGQHLLLGDATLTVAGLIDLEPDRGAGFMNFAPRVLINQADVAATGLIQPASRVVYRLAVAGDDAAVQAFVDWAQAQVLAQAVRGVRVESLQNGRPELSSTLDRAQKFLNLVALLAALLSAVAVALAARGFATRHLNDCAVLRVLGLGQRQMAAAYSFEFALVGLLASVLGVVLGYVVHGAFVHWLGALLLVDLPPAGWAPAGLGLGVGLTLLLAFGLPPVLQLARVPPLRVIRRDVGAIKPGSLGVWALGMAGFVALLLAASRDWRLGLTVVGGFAGATVLFALLAWAVVAGLRRLVASGRIAPLWALATRQLAARPVLMVVQVSSLAVGLLALVLLVLLRTDLIASWRSATPVDAPNRFVINILPEQAQAFQHTLAQAGVVGYDWYPMFRGRLVAVNGRAVGPQDYSDERARRLVDREFNLSHAAQAPAHNPLVAGRWQAEEAGAISVEEGIAQSLGLALGDALTFDIAGVQTTARITSLRKVDWASMRANFFVLFPHAAMPELPITYLCAFRAPARPGFDAGLVRAFPNITSVDVSTTLRQLQQVLDQVIAAVQAVFGFTLAAGLVVLVAALGSTREERARELAILRAVGAASGVLRRMMALELAGVGLLAGGLAGVVASVLAWVLAHYVFAFEWSAPLWAPLGGALAGAALALAVGWWSLREVLQRPVMQTLRQAAD
jgi:putative ABC transport system permease protein